MQNKIIRFRVVLINLIKKIPFNFKGKWSLTLLLCPKNEVKTKLFGYKINLNPLDLTQKKMLLFDISPKCRDFIKKTVNKGDTFFDIGANVGFYSLLASTLVGTGKVFAFEPNPNTCSKLQESIKLNKIKNINVLNEGLGDYNGQIELHLPTSIGNETGTMVKTEWGKSIIVPVNTLDCICNKFSIDKIDYLKIDVDGFEPNVFKGAKYLFKERKIKVIQSEFSDYWLKQNGSSPSLLYNYIINQGFEDLDGDVVFYKDCVLDRIFVRK
jgi:FkbM family methyltransferase